MIDLSFYGFSYSDKNEWIAKALKETGLKSENDFFTFDKIEGISVPSLFTLAEDAEKYRFWESLPKNINDAWENVSSFDLDQENNDDLLQTLALGIDGLVLQWSGEGDIKQKLYGLSPEYLSLWLAPKGNGIAVLKSFLDWANDQAKGKIKGGFLWDPISQVLDDGLENQSLKEQIEKIHQLTKEYPHFRGICVDMGTYLDSGANTVQQLTYSMLRLSEVLKELSCKGRDMKGVFENLTVKVGLGGDYFLNIAKLKLTRILVDQVAGLFDNGYDEMKLIIFSYTSLWTKSHKDKYGNLVRSTVESLMAVNGNSDILFVSKNDLSQAFPDVSSKQQAANISNLLKLESHISFRKDSSSGAFYLNFLMDRIFDMVRDKLIELEGKGGWLACFKSGLMQKEIKLTRNLQVEALKSKSQLMVGVNAYEDQSLNVVSDNWEQRGEAELQLRSIPKSVLFDQLNFNLK
ncbi:methylmalonyl-CoA mutase family protein [Echinicola shivajiensis]|uniref:methylmalonyl-CoA mutase family protein n=1 Tax=Echinicola shivajiensis TaxID=1035916 RepID=UPI001BFC7166|nr:methylmalonyl-CoA mutase family protein [Echinicola shivajiensis]